jgi:hypothetical protein
MKNSKPQYSKPVIVDLDNPDELYASGVCNPVGSGDSGACRSGNRPGGQQCNPTGWVAGKCSGGLFEFSCISGSGV